MRRSVASSVHVVEIRFLDGLHAGQVGNCGDERGKPQAFTRAGFDVGVTFAAVAVGAHLADVPLGFGHGIDDAAHDALPAFVNDFEDYGVARTLGADASSQGCEGEDDDEVHDGDGDAGQPQSSTAGHADSRGFPDGGGGGEASDGSAAGQDDARAEEANAGHDLRGHARGVEADEVCGEDIHEPVFADDHEESGGHADDGVCAQACAFTSGLAFEADHGGEHERQEDSEDLFPVLGRIKHVASSGDARVR